MAWAWFFVQSLTVFFFFAGLGLALLAVATRLTGSRRRHVSPSYGPHELSGSSAMGVSPANDVRPPQT